MPEAAEQIKAITGRIDLVHANDSQGGFDSGVIVTRTSGTEPLQSMPWWNAFAQQTRR